MSIIQENIKNRRSRFPDMYQDRPIDKETMLQILTAANFAPTHRKTEPDLPVYDRGTIAGRLSGSANLV